MEGNREEYEEPDDTDGHGQDEYASHQFNDATTSPTGPVCSTAFIEHQDEGP